MALKVLVAGGGVAALETVIGLRELAGDRVVTLLLAPDREFVYRPLSTGDPFALGAPRTFPLEELVERVGSSHLREGLVSVDSRRHTVRTTGRRTLDYDALVIALGAVQVPAFEHVLTFTGPGSAEAMHGVVQDLEAGYVHRIAFVVPEGITWPLPLYELALQSAERAYETGASVEVSLVTPERSPLEAFGPEAGRAVGELLEGAGVRFMPGVSATVPQRGRVRLGDSDQWIEADRVVAAPLLRGPRIDGLPADRDGFVPTDEHGRVIGVPRVYAAGDVTSFPVKQGGIATQQADAALEVIAAEAGAEVDPQPFHPILRGMLLTGRQPRYIRYDTEHAEGAVAERTLFWPPGKIAGRFLSSFLGEEHPLPSGEGLPLHVDLRDEAPS